MSIAFGLRWMAVIIEGFSRAYGYFWAECEGSTRFKWAGPNGPPREVIQLE